MTEELRTSKKVVGVRQLTRAIRSDEVKAVFLALDADPYLTDPIRAMCAEKDVPVTEVAAMAELGAACGISVGASACGILR